MDFNRNARSVLITAATASLLALVYYLALFFLVDEWRYLVVGGATFLLLLSAIGGLMRLRAGQPRPAVWLLILGGDLVFIAPVTVFSNASLLFAPAIILLVVLISLLVFPERQERSRAIYSALASALVNLLADQVWPFARAPLPAPLILGIGGLMAAVALAYALFFFRSFRDLPLRAKTTALIATLVILTVALVSGLHIFYTRATLLLNAQNSLHNAAESTARSIDNLILSTLTTMRADAQTPILAEFLSISPQDPDYPHEVEEVAGTLLSYKDKNPIFISSYALLNTQGRVLASTEGEEIGKDESQRDYFQKPLQEGLPFFSVWYLENSLYFSAPVRDENNFIVGVLRARYSASFLQQIIVQNRGLAGEGSFPVLFDEHHLILAHGLYAETIFKSLVPLDGDLLTSWQKEGRYPPGDPATFTINLPEVEQFLNQMDRQPFFELTDIQGVHQQAAAVQLSQQPWTLVFAQPQQVFLAPINRQINRSVLLALGATILAAYLALGLSRLLTTPILRLTETARQITAGDLARQATVASRDEIGDLAHAFNEMTARLRDLIANLEQRVAERTAELAQSNASNERRAAQFEAIAQVARAITSTQDLDTLLPKITTLISSRFDFYHVGIFLLDKRGEYAVLSAANSEGGQRMLARGHRLKVGETGIVGYVTGTGNPRVALDTGADAVFFRNPDLPDTRSEMALPLKVGDQVIGALDVQSTQPNAFTEEDVKILSTLADQVSIAIQNARQYEETRRLLAESETLTRQFVQQGWQRFTRSQKLAGIRHSGASAELLPEPIELPKAREAIASGKPQQVRLGRFSTLIVPVKLRGATIGVLNVRAPGDREWDQDELDIVTAIVERAAIAMENARLLAETQKRAAKERTIGEIASKLSALSNVEDLMKAAAQELGHAMPEAEITIQFGMDQEHE